MVSHKLFMCLYLVSTVTAPSFDILTAHYMYVHAHDCFDVESARVGYPGDWRVITREHTYQRGEWKKRGSTIQPRPILCLPVHTRLEFRPNVGDVKPALYQCWINVLCLPGNQCSYVDILIYIPLSYTIPIFEITPIVNQRVFFSIPNNKISDNLIYKIWRDKSDIR